MSTRREMYKAFQVSRIPTADFGHYYTQLNDKLDHAYYTYIVEIIAETILKEHRTHEQNCLQPDARKYPYYQNKLYKNTVESLLHDSDPEFVTVNNYNIDLDTELDAWFVTDATDPTHMLIAVDTFNSDLFTALLSYDTIEPYEYDLRYGEKPDRISKKEWKRQGESWCSVNPHDAITLTYSGYEKLNDYYNTPKTKKALYTDVRNIIHQKLVNHADINNMEDVNNLLKKPLTDISDARRKQLTYIEAQEKMLQMFKQTDLKAYPLSDTEKMRIRNLYTEIVEKLWELDETWATMIPEHHINPTKRPKTI